MNFYQLFEKNGPAFYVAGLGVAGIEPLRKELGEKFPAATVRIVRSAKSTDEENFFNEIGAALQFPEDFVEYWDRFEAFLNDLNWLPGGPLVVLFTFAPFLLCDEQPEVFGELIEILYRVSKNRRSGSLKTLFHVIPTDIPAFLDRLENAGATYTLLTD